MDDLIQAWRRYNLSFDPGLRAAALDALEDALACRLPETD